MDKELQQAITKKASVRAPNAEALAKIEAERAEREAAARKAGAESEAQNKE